MAHISQTCTAVSALHQPSENRKHFQIKLSFMVKKNHYEVPSHNAKYSTLCLCFWHDVVCKDFMWRMSRDRHRSWACCYLKIKIMFFSYIKMIKWCLNVRRSERSKKIKTFERRVLNIQKCLNTLRNEI